MKAGIILAVGGLMFLAGCKDQPSDVVVIKKWQGAPYHIAFDTQAPKPNPAGITIPTIKFTANPDALETRTALVVRFDASGVKKDVPITDQMIMGPVDISGEQGALPADYMDATDKGLAKILGAYCMKGKVKISVALARSSLSPQADENELNNKRLSDWLPLEVEFKNPHPKC